MFSWRRILPLLACWFLVVEARASEHYKWTPTLRDAYFEFQKLRFETAREHLRIGKQQTPDNAFIPYLESYADFLYYLVVDDATHYNNNSKVIEARFKQLEILPATSPYHRMLLAEMRLHTAIIKMKFGQRVSACWEIIKADKLLAENQKRYPTFIPHLKAIGLLNVMVGAVPEEYTWAIRLLGLQGTIGQGMSYLEQVATDSNEFSKEAKVIGLLLQAYVLGQDSFIASKISELADQEPDNLLFHFFAASVNIKHLQAQTAYRYLLKAPKGKEYLAFPFLDYLKGESLLQQGKYQAAFNAYQTFQQTTKGVNYIKDAYLKQFMTQWFLGKGGDKYLIKVKEIGKSNVEPDQYAKRFLEDLKGSPPLPEQKVLYQARYAFDGGDFERAESYFETFTEKSFTEVVNRAEFTYRKGRIAQALGEEGKAIQYYQRTVILLAGKSVYFGAAACLQLGYIYQQRKDINVARTYFNKALSYKKHPYKNSVDNKAKAALSQLSL